MAGDLRPRFAAKLVTEALADTPVVAVNGARQVGKSTLVTQIAARIPDAIVVTLDDRTQREAAAADPRSFVARADPLVIDEVQRVPDLLPAIKAEVDRDRRPGRFVLTGSTRLLSVAELASSLVGRVEIIDLWPLSAGEIDGREERFVDALLGWDPSLMRPGKSTPEAYTQRICAGGFPEPLTRSGRRRDAWFRNYSTTVLEQMLRESTHIERISAMPRLLRLCAARTACELNVTALADDAGIPYRTVGNYLSELERLFLVHRLPAWSRNLTSKVAHRPKLLVTDTGLAAHLLGAHPDGMTRPDSPIGQLMETFVAMEVRKQLAWSTQQADLYHFRDRGGIEVDLVLETPSGHVGAIEVKASSTVGRNDFRGLRLLQDRLGDRFLGGVVLHRGPDAAPFSDRLAAIPLERLWIA